jgi:hypothetical protein
MCAARQREVLSRNQVAADSLQNNSNSLQCNSNITAIEFQQSQTSLQLFRHNTANYRQKSSWLSGSVRFVIVDRSPEPVLETGILVKAPEKNLSNDGEVARASFSLVRFA